MKEKMLKKFYEKRKIVIGAISCIIAIIIAMIVIISNVLNNDKDTLKETSKEMSNKSTENVDVNTNNDYVFTDENITRGTWIKLFAEKFSMINYVEKQPYFQDVSVDDEIFAYVQTCVENDIIAANNKLNLRDKITLKEAFVYLGKAYGKSYVSKRLNKETLSEDDYVHFVCSNADLEIYADKLNYGFDENIAVIILNEIYESYINRQFENKTDIIYKDNVLDMSGISDYAYINNTLQLNCDKDIHVGDIILLGINEKYPEGLALKIIEVVNDKDKYVISADIPTFDEVIETMDIELNQMVDLSDFVIEDGVTLEKVNNNIMPYNSDIYNGQVSTIGILKDEEFDAGIKGTVFKLQVDFKEGKIKKSPQWEKIGLTVDLTGKSDNYYVDEYGKLASKFDKGMTLKGSLSIKDLVLKGSVGYKNEKIRFNVITGMTVKTDIKLEGKIEGTKYKLGTKTLHLGWGLTVNLDLYLNVEFDGSVSVSLSETDTLEVKKSYKGGVNANANIDIKKSCEATASMNVMTGPDLIFKIWSLPVVDVYGYVGIGSQVNWVTDNPNQVVIESYAPLVHTGVGEKDNTVLSLLGIKAKIKVMDIEKAIIKSPICSKITIPLYNAKTISENESTVTSSIEKETKEEQTTAKKEESSTIKQQEPATTNKNEISNKQEETTTAKQEKIEIIASGNRWTLDSNGTFTYFGKGPMEEHDGKGVPAWFEYRYNISKIIISDGVESICSSAFMFEGSEKSNIKEVIIPSTVKAIYSYAFWGCESLTDINIPEGVISIGDEAFFGCSNLKNVGIPSTITSVGYGAFEYTPWLDNKRKNNVLVIENGILIDAQNASGNIIVPNGVRVICGWIFSGNENVTNIQLPNSLKIIDDGVFSSCKNLKSINIPSSVSYIGESAFNGCENITKIVWPNNTNCILNSTFEGCVRLEKVEIKGNLKEIEQSAFAYCTNLKEITLPQSLENLGACSFIGCTSLKTINIPTKITCLWAETFMDCASLVNVNIEGKLTKIAVRAFKNCTSLQHITLSDSLECIGVDVFNNCSSLKDIILPEKLVQLGEEAYNDWENVFRDCIALKEITFLNAKAEFDNSYSSIVIPNLETISGKENSTAEEWAKKFEYIFRVIE